MRFSNSVPAALVLAITMLMPLSVRAGVIFEGDPLIPPGVAPNGSFHFAFVTSDVATAPGNAFRRQG